ncbi:MAG: hypothetical protein N2589_01755 [bacterium]|nr:hypothetical protein [bacterium]
MRRKYFLFILIFLFLAGCFIKYEKKEETVLINPYEEINWGKIRKYKANLHTHTTESDGKEEIQKVLTLYRMKGYSVLSITDHNKNIKLDSKSLFLIPGIEFGKNNQHHILAYFSFEIPSEIENLNEEKILKYVNEKDGFAVFSHPGRYNKQINWYINLFETYKNLIGIEILNTGIQTKGKPYGDTDIWDNLLKKTMPDRPIWGFGNDDFHNISQLAINWNVLLIEKLNEEEIKEAMKKGKFYVCSTILGSDLPELKKIKVNKETGEIRIFCTNYKEIKWISNGEVIGYGPEINYKGNEKIKNYLRVEILGKNGFIYLNPFGIKKQNQ